MSASHGLLIVDLQYGFSPSPDLVERVQDTAEDYAVVAATCFRSAPDNPLWMPYGIFRRSRNGI